MRPHLPLDQCVTVLLGSTIRRWCAVNARFGSGAAMQARSALCPLCAAGSMDQGNTSPSLSAGEAPPYGCWEALSFVVANAQDGIEPLLGVFLQARGWSTRAIGNVMMISGVAGMIATAPAGGLVDKTTRSNFLRYICKPLRDLRPRATSRTDKCYP